MILAGWLSTMLQSLTGFDKCVGRTHGDLFRHDLDQRQVRLVGDFLGAYGQPTRVPRILNRDTPHQTSPSPARWPPPGPIGALACAPTP